MGWCSSEKNLAVKISNGYLMDIQVKPDKKVKFGKYSVVGLMRETA